jgi:hypothetical protein
MKHLMLELQDIYKGIEQSRQTWHDQTKKLIVKELAVLTNLADLDWDVAVNDSIINHETVTVAFRNVPSGLRYNEVSILNQQEGKSGNIVKFGGTLNFSYVYIGDVVIWMTYPYIRDILENTENFVDFFRVKQEKLDTGIIREAVEKFLKEIIAWHTGKAGREQRIGFTTKSEE